MSSEVLTAPAIKLRGVGKVYARHGRPLDRLLQILWPRLALKQNAFVALHPTDLTIPVGETLGLIGHNGAGKSTLLKMIAGVLSPSHGEVIRNGRVAALLELGAGFNPEFTGRENVAFSAALMGLSTIEVAEKMDSIIDFAGLREFIDQPVKTYSSGMFVRLAFSVATSVSPQILVIDEALSVGDGEFARKSFDRIMALKASGVTILFCSHALYQIEVMCDRAIWLEHGQVRMVGKPTPVVAAYEQSIAQAAASAKSEGGMEAEVLAPQNSKSVARITQTCVEVAGLKVEKESEVKQLELLSGVDSIRVRVDFVSSTDFPPPSVAVFIFRSDGLMVACFCTQHDGLVLTQNSAGASSVHFVLKDVPLLKGQYYLDAIILCERTIHLYDAARQIAQLEVRQETLEQGLVRLPHHWEMA